MALRSTHKLKGFSLDAYRKANVVQLLLSSSGNPTRVIFNAYYKNGFSFKPELNVGDFMSVFGNNYDGGPFSSPLWASTVQSLASHFGENMSGALDFPMKPYIKGTKPVDFSIDCFLPLVSDLYAGGNLTASYSNNIKNPLSTLYSLTMPSKSTVSKKISNFVNEKIQSGIDWLFPQDNSFWSAVNDVATGMRQDFVEGMYMLNIPPQFKRGASLTLRMGPVRVPNVFVDSITTSYSDLIYSDGTNNYPAFCDIVLHVKGMKKITLEDLV